MNSETILKDPLFKEFVENRDIAETTQKKYIQWMNKFCDIAGKTPSELLEEAKKEQMDNVWITDRKIKYHLIKLVKTMEREGHSSRYVQGVLTTAKAFYRYHGVQIPENTIKVKRDNGNRQTTEDIPSKDDIKEILKYCNLKYKAIVLLMSSSGMGNAEVIHLTYRNFLDAISKYYKPTEDERFDIPHMVQKLKEKGIVCTWNISRQKTGMPYTTFSTPETTDAILDYLTWRVRHPIQSESDFLFESAGSQIEDKTIVMQFSVLNDRCDFGFSGRSRFFTSHKLRKYFASISYRSGLQQTMIDWFMGHKIDPVTEAYFKRDIKSLKKQYLAIIPHLSIESVKVKDIKSKEYVQLLRDSKAKDDKIASLEKRMELMEQLLNDEKVLEELQKR